MRTKFSTLNIITNLLVLVIQTILSFVVRIVFTKILGQDYLGVESVFVNLISMFSLAELGITLSISFSLYKPLAENNVKKISSLMTLYKKIYQIVGIFILIIGFLIMPFLTHFIDNTNIANFYIIYILYLIDSAMTYLITYKEVLIIADQKNYKINKYNIIAIFSTNVLQIIFLYLTKNFMIYILIKILVQSIQRIIINRYISKVYKDIDFNSKEKLETKELNVIKKNVKSMFTQKIGNYLLNGTDSIIISKFVGIGVVGIYSNFLSITTILKSIVNSITSGITASFGNLIAKGDNKTQENVFNIMNFIVFGITAFMVVELYFLLNPFIAMCFGENYMIDNYCIVVICMNFYLASMLLPLDTVKSAAGIYEKDKYIPLIQAIINLMISMALVKNIGLLGVLLGTMISYLVSTIWIRPLIIYKNIFKSSVSSYYIKYIMKLLFLIGTGFLLTLFLSKIYIENNIFNLITKGIIIAITYSILFVIFNFKTKEFQYLKEEVKKIIKKIRKA